MSRISRFEAKLNRTAERVEDLEKDLEEHVDANSSNVDTYDRKINELTEMIQKICPHENTKLTAMEVGGDFVYPFGFRLHRVEALECTVCGHKQRLTDEMRVEGLKKELEDARERVKRTKEETYPISDSDRIDWLEKNRTAVSFEKDHVLVEHETFGQNAKTMRDAIDYVIKTTE